MAAMAFEAVRTALYIQGNTYCLTCHGMLHGVTWRKLNQLPGTVPYI